MKEKLHTDRVLVVEGKYDASRLAQLTDATILMTDGFGIYSDRKRQLLFKELAKRQGLILFTDSDAAGFRIRTFLTNLCGEKNIVQAYVPAIPGKERRKEQPGKEGLLGVEGIPDEILVRCLSEALDAAEKVRAKNAAEEKTTDAKKTGETESTAENTARPGRVQSTRPITYLDLYEWGLSGTAGAAARKTKLLNALGLPPRLSKKELVEVLNRLYTFEELDEKQRAL